MNVRAWQEGRQPGTGYTPANCVPTSFIREAQGRDGLVQLIKRPAGVAIVAPNLVAQCATYRDAVRLCFSLRNVTTLCARSVSEACGAHPPHMSEYLAHQGRRDMPAKYATAFQIACGNSAISQWMAQQLGLEVWDHETKVAGDA
jgi:hypothetical protein